ncbi:MAG: hypothetical protein AABN95_07985 [Acidobacteriota bacterium]
MPHKRKEPISAAEVNAEIWQYVKRCDDLLREHHGAGSEFVDARDVYEDKHAQETLRAEGTVQTRKALADTSCKAEFLRFIKAETRFKYLKLALDTTRDQLVALESIGSNLRQENELQKYKT